MDPQQTRTARLAGALYLLMGLPGVFYLQYVPRALVVRGDASATAERMLSSEPLFRLGLAAELMSNLIFILTPLVLYQLFKGVDQRKAALMVIFVLVSIPISLVIVVFETAAFTVLTGPDYLSVFAPGQREALALLLVGLHARALDIAEIFWGLWLIPLGLLVYESGFAPRAIGVLLIAAGIAYVATAFPFRAGAAIQRHCGSPRARARRARRDLVPGVAVRGAHARVDGHVSDCRVVIEGTG